ncbi:hypothetical protein DY000_02049635 [Brassica cretica]|uniref:Uncharacterized protein n=1 Tax=Brassica cretica TaxID=69181 RepID=A0ABQ7ESL5_BRACR|nr:hypothetical protein DY000_02049635 [Brassica cretica]
MFSAQSPTASGKSNGYGFADNMSYIFHYVDQIADGMTLQVKVVNLLLETGGGAHREGGAACAQSPTASGKSNGYGFADNMSYIFHYVDQIADGMTLQVKVVNLLLETGGGAHREGGAAWAAHLASITICNLVLYTTNESCKSERSKGLTSLPTPDLFICLRNLNGKLYQIDLPPHRDMFTDANLARSEEENLRDDNGANRVFFGGERFLDGISGQAHTPSSPLLNWNSAEAAGRSLVSVLVDHVFLCIKDAEFQLDLLMQSLLFSRACVSDGESANYLTKILIGGVFLR